jgi:hypothetical protein
LPFSVSAYFSIIRGNNLLSWYIQAAITKYLIWIIYKQTFLLLLDAEKSYFKVPADSAPHLLIEGTLSLHLHMVEGENKSPQASFKGH